MKIQPITRNYRNYRYGNINFAGKNATNTVLGENTGNITPDKSANGKKINPKALFLALALSLSSLSGCSRQNDVSINNSGYSQTIEESNLTENNKKAIDFGKKLLEKGDKITIKETKAYLEKFFKDNSIENVTIEDINNPSNKSRADVLKNLCAAFWVNYNPDGSYKKATMYIDYNPNLKDKNGQIKYASSIAHELTHATQAVKDDTRSGLSDLLLDMGEADKVFSYKNMLMTFYITDYLKMGAMFDYVFENFNEDQYSKLLGNVSEYGIPLFNEPVNVDKNDIEKRLKKVMTELAVQLGEDENKFKDKSLDEIAEYFIDGILGDFINSVKEYEDLTPEKENEFKKAMLKHIMYTIKSETEAYTTNCEVEESAYGFNNSKECLYKFVPKTYEIALGCLERQLAKMQ